MDNHLHLYINNINGLISQYGYLPLLIGCIAEGETFTLLGGVVVHEGLLSFSGVLMATMIGGIIGDQLLFWIGYRLGVRILDRFRKYQHIIDKISFLINKHPNLSVIGVRFMYGCRIIGPIIIGTCRLNRFHFFVLNVIGSALWSLIFVTLGYFAGEIIMLWLHKIDTNSKYLLWILLIILIFCILRYIIKRRKL